MVYINVAIFFKCGQHFLSYTTIGPISGEHMQNRLQAKINFNLLIIIIYKLLIDSIS